MLGHCLILFTGIKSVICHKIVLFKTYSFFIPLQSTAHKGLPTQADFLSSYNMDKKAESHYLNINEIY